MYIFSPDEGNNAFGIYFLINSFYDSFLQQRKELNKASFQLKTRKTESASNENYWQDAFFSKEFLILS